MAPAITWVVSSSWARAAPMAVRTVSSIVCSRARSCSACARCTWSEAFRRFRSAGRQGGQ